MFHTESYLHKVKIFYNTTFYLFYCNEEKILYLFIYFYRILVKLFQINNMYIE